MKASILICGNIHRTSYDENHHNPTFGKSVACFLLPIQGSIVQHVK